MKGKNRALLLLFLVVSISISSAYLFLPSYFGSLDSQVRDFYFKFRGVQKSDERIVVVDIDEKSIKELGQWPWERSKIAKILQNLTDAGAGIIGLDIVFSEADKTSPQKIAKQWSLNARNLPNYDEILAKTITQTPTILSYVFDFNAKKAYENEAPSIPAIFIEKSKHAKEFLPQANGVLTNLELIQNAGYSSGYMNNIPDESGIIRSVPLLIKYDMQVYPSLSFEMYRILLGAKKITLKYSEAGIDDVIVGQKYIKSDRFAKLHLNFRGPFKTYKYLSAVDIYNNKIDKSLINGKYIFMGTSAYGLMDLRATPMDSVIAGVEIQANILDNLLNGDMLYKPNWIELVDLIFIVLTAFIIIFIFSRFKLRVFIPIYFATFTGSFVLNYYILFQKYIIVNTIFPMSSMLISLIGTLGINYLFESRQKELIKGSFSKKVSKQVMDDLLANPDNLHLSSREVNATIYFSDIRSFTTISETLHSPKRITDFLNFYMNAMVQSVEKYSGTIDKFIGDAVMAYWNAPLEIENHADKAVLTALEQVGKRGELNETIHKKFGFDVDYGIGINTGDVVVGEIGSEGRSDYTIIGDAVNLASRLEGLCKPYKVRLIISEFTKELLVGSYVIQLLDIVRVKGKHEPIKIYEVQQTGKADDKKLLELKRYDEAHAFYMNANFKNAETMFENLYAEYDKYLYTMYAKRCRHLMDEQVKNFDGVFEFTTK